MFRTIKQHYRECFPSFSSISVCCSLSLDLNNPKNGSFMIRLYGIQIEKFKYLKYFLINVNN